MVNIDFIFKKINLEWDIAKFYIWFKKMLI